MRKVSTTPTKRVTKNPSSWHKFARKLLFDGYAEKFPGKEIWSNLASAAKIKVSGSLYFSFNFSVS